VMAVVVLRTTDREEEVVLEVCSVSPG
jgi:hypothetical protein